MTGNKLLGRDERFIGGMGQEREVGQFLQQAYEGELRRRAIAGVVQWLLIAKRLGLARDIGRRIGEIILKGRREEWIGAD